MKMKNMVFSIRYELLDKPKMAPLMESQCKRLATSRKSKEKVRDLKPLRTTIDKYLWTRLGVYPIIITYQIGDNNAVRSEPCNDIKVTKSWHEQPRKEVKRSRR